MKKLSILVILLIFSGCNKADKVKYAPLKEFQKVKRRQRAQKLKLNGHISVIYKENNEKLAQRHNKLQEKFDKQNENIRGAFQWLLRRDEAIHDDLIRLEKKIRRLKRAANKDWLGLLNLRTAFHETIDYIFRELIGLNSKQIKHVSGRYHKTAARYLYEMQIQLIRQKEYIKRLMKGEKK
ncbi:hypothetical protein ACFL29_01115 [Patescibacteria group bacterium]